MVKKDHLTFGENKKLQKSALEFSLSDNIDTNIIRMEKYVYKNPYVFNCKNGEALKKLLYRRHYVSIEHLRRRKKAAIPCQPLEVGDIVPKPTSLHYPYDFS